MYMPVRVRQALQEKGIHEQRALCDKEQTLQPPASLEAQQEGTGDGHTVVTDQGKQRCYTETHTDRPRR